SANLTHGQPVTATVTVAPGVGAGTPTGDVSLLAAGSRGVNLGNLSNGTVSGSVETLPGGMYSVTARYGGDAAVGASTPTGTLTFSDTFNGNTSTLLSVSLNSQGNALVQETKLALGNHTLNVSYSGDASFSASSAGPINVSVAKGPTQTILFIPTGALPN